MSMPIINEVRQFFKGITDSKIFKFLFKHGKKKGKGLKDWIKTELRK